MNKTLEVPGRASSRLTPQQVKWIVIACAIYVFFPLDLIPDAIPFGGGIDDLVAFLLAIRTVKNAARPEGSAAA